MRRGRYVVIILSHFAYLYSIAAGEMPRHFSSWRSAMLHQRDDSAAALPEADAMPK